MLVSSKEMISKAAQGSYAIGAFNVSNLETLKAVIQAAEAKRAPIILATTETIINYAGLPYISALIKTAAEVSSLPMALHLDHGKSMETVKKCLEVGYNSIMIDASQFDFEQNVKLTKEVVDLCQSKNIPVEGEIGQLSSEKSKLASPAEAKEFVQKTGVDFLAAAVGTTHGLQKDEHVDLDLLTNIRREVDIPLVLHGGSGVPDDEIKKAIKQGIAKVNIHTEIRLAFIKGFQEGLKQYPDSDDHREILQYSIEATQQLVEEKIELFGSSNKA